MQTCQHPSSSSLGWMPKSAYALFSGLIHDIRNARRMPKAVSVTIELGGDMHNVGFRRVHPTQHPLYLGFAMGFMTSIGRIGELEAVQAFWPDATESSHLTWVAIWAFSICSRASISVLSPREIRDFQRRWG